MPTYAVGTGTGTKGIPINSIDSWQSFSGGWPLPWTVPTGTPKSNRELLSWVGYLYRAVDLRANALSALPWSIYRGNADTPLWTSQEPAPPAVLEPFAVLPEMFYRLEAALCIGGRAYIHKGRNRVALKQLTWLDPATMEPYWTPAGIEYFKRQVNGAVAHLPPDDVVYVWLTGLSETEPRPSPAQAAANAANVLYNSAEFAKAYFARGAVKAGLLTVDTSTGAPLPAERERLKTWWTRFMSGIGNAFNAEVVSADVKYVPVGEGLAELSNQALTEEQRTDIATAFGVPHSLVMSNAANYATAQQDAKAFYETTVVPEAQLIERQINRQLFEPMGLRFKFQPNSLDVFQEDENERAAAFAAYVNAGIKPSIVAQMLGLELPEGVTYDDLDPEPQPVELVAAPPDAPGAPERQADDERETERKRFRAWARKRKNPDPAAFKSDLLTDEDKEALLGEMRGGFRVEWDAYP